MPFSVGSFPNGEDDKGKKFWTNLNFSQILNQIVKGGWFGDNYINTCAFLVRAKLHLADRCSLGRLHSPIYNALLVSFSSVLLSKNRVLGTWRRLMQRAHSSCYVTISSHLIFSLNYICCFHYRQLPKGGYFESPSNHTYFDLFMLWRNLSFLKANQPPTGKSRMSPVQLTFRREILIIHYRWAN